MGFIRSGFTGGFLGIVISVADIFVKSQILERLSSLGLLLASQFGKVCINTPEEACTLTEKFTTILATIIGNCIAYFLVFVIISLGMSVIAMWFRPSKKVIVEETTQPQQQTIMQPQAPQPQIIQIKEVRTEKRPKKKAKVRKN